MKTVVLAVCCIIVWKISWAYEDNVKQYAQEINDFIKSTESFTRPTDSREFLMGKNEDILKECSDFGEYDFIIVGAGSSGSVLANRLSEEAVWRVLLLEAGGQETFVSQIPAMFDYLKMSRFNWGYKSVPQKNSLLAYIDQSQLIARGKALGGSSAINLMMYVRGNREDFNLWSRSGNPGWSYRDLLPLFIKSEQTHIYRPDPGYHGVDGALRTENMNVLSPLTYAFLLANQELGREVMFDYNGQEQLGFGVAQTTMKHGHRESGAKAFLEGIQSRHNLKILTDTFVTKVLISNKVAYGVQFIKNGVSYCAKTTKEVILSSGTINTPQLLMLSGIGPKQHLQNLNITSIQDLPGVGQNMWDHILHTLQPFTTNYTMEDISQNEAIRRYLHGKGSLTSPDSNQDLGFVNLLSNDSRPDVEHIFRTSKMPNISYQYFRDSNGFSEDMYNYLIKPLVGQTTWSSYTILLHPKSRGNLKLKTNSPFDFPEINPNYFSDPADVKTMVAAQKDVLKISKTKSFQRYNSTMFKINLPACKKFTYQSDEYFECSVKNLVSSVGHFSGTCKMGMKNDSQAVVDNELKVYGIQNLRVVDCSVIPVTTSGHTNAVAYVIGEKAADLIKKEYYSKEFHKYNPVYHIEPVTYFTF